VAAAAFPAFQTVALNLGAGVAVAGLAGAAGGGADQDKVAPGAPVITNALDDQNAVTGQVDNAGVTNDLLPQLVINAAPGSAIKVFEDVGGNWVTVAGTAVEGQTHTFKATASDAAGNESALSTPFSLTFDTAAPAMPTLVVDDVTANNDVSPSEALGSVNVTGSTSAPQGSVVTVSVNNKTFTGTVSNGAFTIAVPGADLVADTDTQLAVSVAATDAAGNSTTKEVTKDYTASEAGAAPTVTLNPVATDGILNAAESAQEFTAITGTTTGAQVGNGVTLSINGASYTGTVVAGGGFSIAVPTASLRDSPVKSIAVTLTTASASANDDIAYAVDVTPPSAYSLTVEAVTADNVLTSTEAGVTQQVTGTTNAPNGTTVSVQVNGVTYAALAQSGRYSIAVPGAQLDADTDKTIQVSVTSTDAAGNTTVATANHGYSTGSGTAPTITINMIAGDDLLTDAEIQADADGDGLDVGDGYISVTGSVTGANVGDEVTITVNGHDYVGELNAGGNFSIGVLGTDLRDDLTLDAVVTTINSLGETLTGTASKTVGLFVLETTPPTVGLSVLGATAGGTEVRFTFSEPITPYPLGADPANPTGFTPFDMALIDVQNGTLGSFVQDPTDSTVWTAVFTPDSSGERGVITLPPGSFSDLQDNDNVTEASLPIWQVNTSGLTIDYSSSLKADWVTTDWYENNSWNWDESYRTDGDDVFAYDFGRIFWDDSSTDPADHRWELMNWQIGVGDRIRGATLLDFDGDQSISVPESFGSAGGGDDQIDNGQFEVYYGTLVDGTFTVTSTEEFNNSGTGKGGATHTMILFDNDTQDRYSNTLNDRLNGGNDVTYLPSLAYSPIYGEDEVYLNDPYWLDALIVQGVYLESGWQLDSGTGSQNLNWIAPPLSDYISIGRLDPEKTAFGAWFDADENGVYDTGEQTLTTSHYYDSSSEYYYYELDAVDFSAGSYTIRFVDSVFGQSQGLELEQALVMGLNGFTLDLSFGGFGSDDKVIIDKLTNEPDWLGIAAEVVGQGVELVLGSERNEVAYLGVDITPGTNVIFMV
jgi:uncharacterized protein (UPF0333 family)